MWEMGGLGPGGKLWEEDTANSTVRANRAGFRNFSRTMNREDDGVCVFGPFVVDIRNSVAFIKYAPFKAIWRC